VTAVNELAPMLGRTIASIDGGIGDDAMTFTADDGARFELWYEPDCCASCYVNDITGDLVDLIGSPLLMAEEVSSDGAEAPEHADSYTWTFYKFATVRGYVTVRWLGESNGYYSESVSFRAVPR
jgi:hypothetical protein